MKLIADSGSTKTDWRLIKADNSFDQTTTIGLNPYYVSVERITDEVLKDSLLSGNANKVSAIHFYGSGCSSEDKKKVIVKALSGIFKNAEIEVQHDLLGAARALCGREAGIAAILGTGSNSCEYNGKKIITNIPSLGFILGDEGSGAHLGKELLKAFAYNELPDDLKKKFDFRYKTTIPEILENTLQKPMANRYMAGFAKFLFHNISHPFVSDIVIKCFTEFFDRHICKYDSHKNVPVHFVGSIAYYFGDRLRYVAEEKGIVVGNILEKPIAALTLYHSH
jgi:glucosamine kinase